MQLIRYQKRFEPAPNNLYLKKNQINMNKLTNTNNDAWSVHGHGWYGIW